MKLAGQKTRVFIIVELGISLALLLLIILPSWQNIEGSKKTITERRVTQAETNQLTERSNDLIQRSGELEGKINTLQDRLISSATALDFLTQLESAASASNVVLDVKSFDQPSAQKKEGALSLSTIGSFSEVLGFIHEIERLNWLLQIESVSFSPSAANNRSQSDTDTGNAVTLSLEASTFWKE